VTDQGEVDAVDLNWRKSTRSAEGGGNCVEIALISAGAAIRDSKNPIGPQLRFPAARWQSFLTQVAD
jgi:hypothetical protein